MTFHDERLAARQAAARERELDRAYAELVAHRTRRDVVQLAAPLASLTGEPKQSISHAYLSGQQMKVVEIETGVGQTAHKIVAIDEPLPPGLKILREQSLAEIIDYELGERERGRAFFMARAGQSVDLATTNPELLARDVRAAKERVEQIEQEIEKAAPAETKQRLRGMRMTPELRREVEKALDTGDQDTLVNVVALRRVVRGPTGTVAFVEARRFDPDTWPMLDDDARERLGPGTQQFTIADLVERTRTRLTAVARFGEKVVQREDFPSSLRGE